MSSKKKKRGTVRCYCGKKLKPKDKRCQRCDRMTARGQRAALRKAAATGGSAFLGKVIAGSRGPAFVGKAAPVVPITAARGPWRCYCEGVNNKSARFCVHCGLHKGATAGEHLDYVTNARRARMAIPGVGSVYDADPARADLVWKLLHGTNGRGGAA